MATKVMKQVMIERTQEKFLASEAKRARRSRSQVIRDAIDQYAALPESERAPVRARKGAKVKEPRLEPVAQKEAVG